MLGAATAGLALALGLAADGEGDPAAAGKGEGEPVVAGFATAGEAAAAGALLGCAAAGATVAGAAGAAPVEGCVPGPQAATNSNATMAIPICRTLFGIQMFKSHHRSWHFVSGPLTRVNRT
jgi:hypothetical protein